MRTQIDETQPIARVPFRFLWYSTQWYHYRRHLPRPSRIPLHQLGKVGVGCRPEVDGPGGSDIMHVDVRVAGPRVAGLGTRVREGHAVLARGVECDVAVPGPFERRAARTFGCELPVRAVDVGALLEQRVCRASVSGGGRVGAVLSQRLEINQLQGRNIDRKPRLT